MDGIHDLGGMQGFGPVPVATDDAAFRDLKDWEKRMWGLSRNTLAPGVTIDWFRHGLERMVPADYLSFAYFQKWATNFLMLMLDNGTLTLTEVVRGHVDDTAAPAATRTLDDVLAINRGACASFATEAPSAAAFAVGQAVHTLRHMPDGHTRLPRYARDASGTVIAAHGCHLLPEEGAKGRHVGQHLYTISFAATELWGSEANPRDTVTLDLWESHLVPA